MANLDYQNLYNYNYFIRHNDNNSYFENRLRFPDQFPSILYAFNLSCLEILSAFKDCSIRDFVYDNRTGISCWQQFEEFKKLIATRPIRNPISILEIGSGRGEILAFLNYAKTNITNLDYKIQTLDCSPDLEQMYQSTCRRLFNCNLPQHLIIGTLAEKYKDIDFESVDTIIMSEVLEHLYPEEFYEFYEYALPYLRKNSARLIITNAWGYWPIEENGSDHVWTIDDSVYDKISIPSKSVIVRSKSHLVLDF